MGSPLVKSVSDSNLNNGSKIELSQFLLDALAAHQRHQEEQAEIEAAVMELMEKAKKRR